MPRSFLLLFIVLLVACSPSSTSVTSTTRPATKPAAIQSTKTFTPPPPHDPQVAALIRQLASEFPSGLPGHMAPSTPLNEDAADRRSTDGRRVGAAYKELASLGVAAFPDLIDNIEDPHYSFTASFATRVHVPVGAACIKIMQEQIDFWGYGYKSRQGANGRSAIKTEYLYAMRDNPGLPAWWEAHKTRSLRELQIESLQWTIQKETTLGFTDDAQRHQILDPLQTRLAELQSQPATTP